MVVGYFVRLTFYADESFNDRCFCFGGWLAEEKVWTSIGNQWEKRIAYERRIHGKLRRYHATDCNGGYKEYKNWTKPQRDQHTKKLLKIITKKKEDIVAICFGLDRISFRQHFSAPKDDLGAAYNVAVRRTMMLIAKVMKRHSEDRLAIIHSDAPGYNGLIQDAFDTMMNDPAYSHYRKIFTTIAPLKWEDCIQLQPADMIAFEAFKLIDSDLHSTEPKIRRSLEAFDRARSRGGRSLLQRSVHRRTSKKNGNTARFLTQEPMTRLQRIAAFLYCLAVVYCCIWVPWRVTLPSVGELQQGCRWLWTLDAGGPNIAAIALRLIAVTALGGAAFLLTGKWKGTR